MDAQEAIDLAVGSVCLVALPAHGRLDAVVVGIRSQSLHLKFMQTDPEEVRAFITAHGGQF